MLQKKINPSSNRINIVKKETFKKSFKFEKYGESIAIILGYHNGEEFIDEQLQSIMKQTHKNFRVFIFDDCSRKKLNLNQTTLSNHEKSKITITRRKKNVGFQNNFLKALLNIPNCFDYYAFCDQDDIWRKNKLKKAINMVNTQPKNIPNLYCARTEISDSYCKKTFGFSPIFKKKPCFANAIIQSLGGGNTMLFNLSAKKIIESTYSDIKVVSHDWWCYQIVTGCGGFVTYDLEPCLKYRQHKNNVIGSNTNWSSRFSRMHLLIKGSFKTWNDINIKALYKNYNILSVQNQKILNDFVKLRNSNLIKKLFFFKHTPIYRQTKLGNLSLLIGLLLNKV